MKPGDSLRFLTSTLPLGFLLGCASTVVQEPKQQPPQVVEGSGTADERKVIDASNQRVFDLEHSQSDTTSGANQGVP